jgi:hypothetical protein
MCPSVGPHQNRARGGKTGGRASARRLDDVYESAPAAAQALDAGIIRSGAASADAAGLAALNAHLDSYLVPGPNLSRSNRAPTPRGTRHRIRSPRGATPTSPPLPLRVASHADQLTAKASDVLAADAEKAPGLGAAWSRAFSLTAGVLQAADDEDVAALESWSSLGRRHT